MKAELSHKLIENKSIAYKKEKAIEIIKTGFNAGDSYQEVWIRDFNTFIELATKVYSSELKETLLIFFRLQGEDGNIVDGFMPRGDNIILA